VVVRIRRWRVGLLTGGGQLGLGVLGFQLESRSAWLIILPLIAALSLWAWTAMFRRYRAVGDTPTSQVASAAQGYVELSGRAQHLPETKTLAPLSGRECCWYQYRRERRGSKSKWVLEEEGESAAAFRLRDTTGVCVVDPDDAEILTAHKQVWTEGDRRFTEWWIADGDPLYALGEFRTLTAAGDAVDRKRDIGAVLAEWKRDRPQLLQRFDLDRDGEISFKEWSLARAEAKRQVERTHAELAAVPPLDVVGAPRDGRLYLLSNFDPSRLSRRFALWAWAHLAGFFAALAVLVYLLV
jgi:hypothetical protein